jgi:hypothetical protein
MKFSFRLAWRRPLWSKGIPCEFLKNIQKQCVDVILGQRQAAPEADP